VSDAVPVLGGSASHAASESRPDALAALTNTGTRRILAGRNSLELAWFRPGASSGGLARRDVVPGGKVTFRDASDGRAKVTNWRSVLAVVASFLFAPTWLGAQCGASPITFSPERAQAGRAPGEIARELADRGRLVVISAKTGTAKHKIDEDEEQFALPYGESPVALFRLPDHASPYTLKLASLCHCFGFNKSIFVPSGIFLDAEYRETRRFGDDDLTTNPPGYGAREVIGGTFGVSDEDRPDRYLLIYTRGDLLGGTADRLNAAENPNLGLVPALLIGSIRVARSVEGTVELEIVPGRVEGAVELKPSPAPTAAASVAPAAPMTEGLTPSPSPKARTLDMARQAIELDPDSWKAHAALLDLYQQWHMQPQIEEHLLEIVASDLSDEVKGWAHGFLGVVRSEEGQHAAAVEEIRTGVALKPDLLTTMPTFGYRLGMDLRAIGRLGEATTVLENVRQRWPRFLAGRLELGKAYVDAGEKKKSNDEEDFLWEQGSPCAQQLSDQVKEYRKTVKKYQKENRGTR
jgi:tetratricopeptide (TPR) repeat protein